MSTEVSPSQVIDDYITHLHRVLTLEEEMDYGFIDLFAKLTKPTIWPSAALEAVGRPHTRSCRISQAKKLAFRGSPILPKRLRHIRVCHAFKL
jgi:hypothetical protein